MIMITTMIVKHINCNFTSSTVTSLFNCVCIAEKDNYDDYHEKYGFDDYAEKDNYDDYDEIDSDC